MTPTQVAAAVAAVLLGNTVKGLVGFGSAIVAIPLISLVLPPAHAMVLVCGADLAGSGALLWRARADVPLREVSRALPSLVAGMTLGTSLQATLDVGTTRQLVGGAVLLLGGWMLRGPVRAAGVTAPSTPLLAATGLLGGVSGGLVGMPGPPLAALAGATLPIDQGRAFLLAVLSPGTVVFLTMMVARGLAPPSLVGVSALLAPVAAFGAIAGLHLAGRVPTVWVRRVAAAVVAASGLALLRP